MAVLITAEGRENDRPVHSRRQRKWPYRSQEKAETMAIPFTGEDMALPFTAEGKENGRPVHRRQRKWPSCSQQKAEKMAVLLTGETEKMAVLLTGELRENGHPVQRRRQTILVAAAGSSTLLTAG